MHDYYLSQFANNLNQFKILEKIRLKRQCENPVTAQTSKIGPNKTVFFLCIYNSVSTMNVTDITSLRNAELGKLNYSYATRH